MIDVTSVIFIAFCFGASAVGYALGQKWKKGPLERTPKAPDEPKPDEPEPPSPRRGLFPFDDVPLSPPREPDEVVLNSKDDDDDESYSSRVGASFEGSAPPSGLGSVYQPQVHPIVVDVGADAPVRGDMRFRIEATAKTDPGRRRKRNEDRFLVLPEENLFVVADGMGGHRGGELASQIATEAIALAAATQTYDGEPHSTLPAPASELARAVQMANAAIRDYISKKPEMEGMGTTVVAVRFIPEEGRLYIAHVGDSRLYRFRGDVLSMVTTDHTMAELGVLGPAAAALSRAVGIWATTPIDVLLATPEIGDRYLLCSDGLTKMIADDAILSVLRTDEPPDASVARLVSLANAHGGRDNITVVLLQVLAP